MISNILRAFVRVKSLNSVLEDSKDSTKSPGLKKCLTLYHLIAYGVGCSVGAGIYSLIGIGAQITGSSISVSFLISGIACIFTSLTYSEFAARIPVTGSAYTFVYISFGELAAWVVGWNLTLGYGISAGGIARSWASYAEVFLGHLGLQIPHWLIEMELYGQNCSILAAILIIACTLILLAGVHESAKFNTIITILNIIVLVLTICIGSTQVQPQYWSPFTPSGLHGIIQGAGVIFFAYLGFDMVACLAEEVEHPEKNLPRGIVLSLLISMTIYIGVSIVITGMAPVKIIGATVPLVNAFSFHHMEWFGRVISFGSMFGLTTAAFTCLMGQPRIFYRMALDGLLPSVFAQLNLNTQIPTGSTIITGIFISIISFLFDLDFLAHVISCGTLLVFTFVNAGSLLLRLKHSENNSCVEFLILFFIGCIALTSFGIQENWEKYWILCFGFLALMDFLYIVRLKTIKLKTFQCPWVPFVPCMGIVCNVYMLTNLPLFAWMGVGIWLSIGLIIYLSYGIRNSTLAHPLPYKENDLHAESTPLMNSLKSVEITN